MKNITWKMAFTIALVVHVVFFIVAYANAQEPMDTIQTSFGRVPIKKFQTSEWMAFEEECDAGYGVRHLATILVDCGEGKLCRDPDNVCHCYLPAVYKKRDNGTYKRVMNHMCLMYEITYN